MRVELSNLNPLSTALVPFGQSGIGQLVNQAAQQGQIYVDEPGDSGGDPDNYVVE